MWWPSSIDIAFNSYTSSDEPTITQEAFADAALQDVFDAVSFFFHSNLSW
jgi:hypothetical protein